MSTSTLVLLLVAIIVSAIAVVSVTHLREKARVERARQLIALEGAYKRANQLFTELPGQYQSTDMALLLIKQMEHCCNGLAALKTALPIDKWRDALTELKQQVRNGEYKPAPARIDSPQKVAAVKELLQNLFDLVETMHKAGRIDSATAKSTLKNVVFLTHKTHTDLYVFQAREYVRQNEIRKAIHAYHLASTEMGQAADNPLAMKSVKSFRTRIRELEALTSQSEQSGASPNAPQKYDSQRQDKEWDSFLEDDSWKKKADYDD